MSEGDRRPCGDANYGELLGEYFTVVNEISRRLDASGRPKPGYGEEYAALREQKTQLLEELERAKPDYADSDIKTILDDALETNKPD